MEGKTEDNKEMNQYLREIHIATDNLQITLLQLKKEKAEAIDALNCVRDEYEKVLTKLRDIKSLVATLNKQVQGYLP